MDELWFRSELKEIGRSECLELLERISVGRVGYSASEGTVVLPVNHAIIGGEIVVRIVPYGQTARYLHDNAPGASLSYEVDEYDEETQTGWSVLVMGTARAVDPENLPNMTDPPVPWPAGGFWNYVRIRPDRVTGRRLVPS